MHSRAGKSNINIRYNAHYLQNLQIALQLDSWLSNDDPQTILQPNVEEHVYMAVSDANMFLTAETQNDTNIV